METTRLEDELTITIARALHPCVFDESVLYLYTTVVDALPGGRLRIRVIHQGEWLQSPLPEARTVFDDTVSIRPG